MFFRTNDPSRWGNGLGSNLTAAQIDQNFWELLSDVNNLIANPVQPNTIVGISSTGSAITFQMSDGSTIGPVFFPVLQFRWRSQWQPTTLYQVLDVFTVPGIGLFSVLENHTSGATFNAQALGTDSGNLYLTLFEFPPAVNLIYDIGFYYPGLLNLLTSDITYIYQEPLTRAITLPAAPTNGTHQAYLENAPSTEAQTFNIYQNDAVIGTVSFALGQHVGTVSITADASFVAGDRLAVGKPTLVDATAEGLSIVFAAIQVVVPG